MASFAGVSFVESGDGPGQYFPTFDRHADISVHHVVGGNTNIIQTSGLTVDKLALAIQCTKAQHNSLRSAVGTTGTLSYSYGTRTAFLEAVESPRVVRSNDLYLMTLKFIGQ